MKFTSTSRIVAAFCFGAAVSITANAQVQLKCPQDWSALADISGPNLDKVILGVKARDWKKVHLDQMLSKEEECYRTMPGPESLKKATLIDVQKYRYPNAVADIEERDRRQQQSFARSRQVAEEDQRKADAERQQQLDRERAAVAQRDAEEQRRADAQRQQQLDRERATAAQREKDDKARNAKASCDAVFTRAKFPEAWRNAVYLADWNSPEPFPDFLCSTSSKGAQVRYLSGGAFSKEGFEVKGKSRTVQVFIEKQRIPGGDPNIPLMVPVSAKIDGEKMAITRETFRVFIAELITATLY